MKPIYARKETNNGLRRVMLDMAYLATHKKIRFPKYYMEEGLYFPYLPDKNNNTNVEKFSLAKDKAKKEDENFYYFDFPFKPEQVEDIAV